MRKLIFILVLLPLFGQSQLIIRNGSPLLTNARTFITSQVIATDANITASAGQSIVATANLFTANRTIDLSGLNQDNDYLEIYLGSSQNFNLSPTGQTLYFSDDVNTVTKFLTQLHYQIRRKNGRLYIIN